MRYIVMHKVDDYIESGSPAKPDIIEKMGQLVQESLKSGIFTNGAGLHRSALRARLRCRGGDCSVTRGPYPGENELVASMAMISARKELPCAETSTLRPESTSGWMCTM